MKKVLYLDMDGVVADFEKEIERLSPDIYARNSSSLDSEIDAICAQNPSIFEYLPFVKGAKEAVLQLLPIYDLYFLSSPMWDLPSSFSGKRIWLEKHFGESVRRRLILTHRKDLNLGDFLVDDRLKNGASEFSGRHIHFGSNDFPDWESVLCFLLSSSK